MISEIVTDVLGISTSQRINKKISETLKINDELGAKYLFDAPRHMRTFYIVTN